MKCDFCFVRHLSFEMTNEVTRDVYSSDIARKEANDNGDNLSSISLISESDVDNSFPDAKTEDEKKPIVCDFCGKVFKFNSHFVIHRRCHTGERPFVCNVCNKKFVSNGSLRKHNSVHSERTLVCDICSCAFKSIRALRKHNAVHSEVKAFKCKICNKCFRFQETLIVHKAVHSDVRPYVCVLCNSTFKLKAHLLKHNISHTKEKHFSCQICGEKFMYRSTWERHMRMHTGEKPYVCELCGKSFYQNCALKSHLRSSHMRKVKDKEMCAKCNRRWPVSCINDHIKVCVGVTQYPCRVCGNVFYYSYSLKKHLRSHMDKTTKVLCTKCNRSWPVGCINDHITVCIGSNS